MSVSELKKKLDGHSPAVSGSSSPRVERSRKSIEDKSTARPKVEAAKKKLGLGSKYSKPEVMQLKLLFDEHDLVPGFRLVQQDTVCLPCV